MRHYRSFFVLLLFIMSQKSCISDDAGDTSGSPPILSSGNSISSTLPDSTYQMSSPTSGGETSERENVTVGNATDDNTIQELKGSTTKPVFNEKKSIESGDSNANSEENTEEDKDYQSLVESTDTWGEMIEPEDESWLKEASDLDLLLREEVQSELDKESFGQYKQKRSSIKRCFDSRMELVWQEFSPFFNYKYDEKYKNFVSLFLAIWKNESYYVTPKRGVIVQSNCKKLPPFYTKPLAGEKLKQDLVTALKKEKTLEKRYPRCNLKNADYGPLQWNQKWRLSRKFYRPNVETALRISTKYPKKDIAGLSRPDITRLIKFNAHALFLLAGIAMKEHTHEPLKYIKGYNSKREYHQKVFSDYKKFRLEIKNAGQCMLPKSKKSPRKVKK